MPLQIPDRSEFDQLIDHDRALVALAVPSQKEREKLVRIAKDAGLALETGSEPGLSADVVGRTGTSATIRIRQDVTITVDGLELERDDIVLKQELRIDPRGEGKRRGRLAAPSVAQSNNTVWLVGKGAVARIERALVEAHFDARVAVAPVYHFPSTEHGKTVHYAIDPWFVDIRSKAEHGGDVIVLPRELERYLTILKDVPPAGGRWYRARLTEPVDTYDLARRFLETTDGKLVLCLRGLPMIVPFASFPPPDPDYPTRQQATLSHIFAQNMWNIAGTSATSAVKVFYLDSGVFAPGIDVGVDTLLSVAIDQFTGGTPPYALTCLPGDGDPHGTQMVAIAGAQWGFTGMAGVTGLRTNVSHVSLRCHSLSHVTDALGYAASILGSAKGVVVIGLDVLNLYATAKLCIATQADATRFDSALLQAMTTGDLVVIAPSGNYDPSSSSAVTTIPGVPADTRAFVVVGAADQACTSRWNDPTTGASRFGTGLDMVAPGVNVYTAFNTTLPTPSYGQVWGTSFAAAHVAGIAALLRAAHPTLNAAGVKTKLVASCWWPGGTPPADVGHGIPNGATAVT
ncbi:MAG TPA: S8/S53 family peptidase [Polyangiaceae bacterium]|jgi:subtilisin family serine protease|nr:S8/S53 family peptidase [Polyangiaceae bacterium]